MPWKPLEKSGLEPTAPNRQADRKHCALSTQPNPHLHGAVLRHDFIGVQSFLLSSSPLAFLTSRTYPGHCTCMVGVPWTMLAPQNVSSPESWQKQCQKWFSSRNNKKKKRRRENIFNSATATSPQLLSWVTRYQNQVWITLGRCLGQLTLFLSRHCF